MRLSTAVLSLALGLGVVGLAAGEEESTGSWVTRLFAGSSVKTAPAGDQKIAARPAPPLPAGERLRQASATWQRRQDACLKLRDLADQLDDEDLRQKVELLEQRSWDAYLNATSFNPGSPLPGVNPAARSPRPRQPSTKENP